MAANYPKTSSTSQEESQLIREIGRLANSSSTIEIAVERIAALLESAAGARIFSVETNADAPSVFVRQDVRDFLAAPEARCRLIYAVPLKDHGRDIGRLVAAFADPALPADVPQRLAKFAGEQLGTLHARAQRLVRMQSKPRRSQPPARLSA